MPLPRPAKRLAHTQDAPAAPRTQDVVHACERQDRVDAPEREYRVDRQRAEEQVHADEGEVDVEAEHGEAGVERVRGAVGAAAALVGFDLLVPEAAGWRLRATAAWCRREWRWVELCPRQCWGVEELWGTPGLSLIAYRTCDLQ